jgi:amino acid transporter
MLFTALSYGRLAAAFPVAGSAYTYTRRAIDARVGFLVGWAVLLDYFFIPMVIWLIGAAYLNGQFPAVPAWVWILLFIMLTTVLNVLGIKVAATVNLLLMAMQVLVLIFFVVASYATQLVAAGVHVSSADTAASDIAKAIGGQLFGAIFLAGLAITQFASGIAAQASASRLLYAMGRDGVLPRRIFGFVHRASHTPVFNIGLIGVVGIIAVWLNVSESTGFINFGAFTAFTFVNMCVIAPAIRNRILGTARGILLGLVAPLIGAGVDVWLLTNLDRTAIILGVSWLVIGICYLLYLTRGFRIAPPEMSFAEEDAVVSDQEAVS